MKDTGGPAFPEHEWNNDVQRYLVNGGMTLRDYFAAKALQGILSGRNGLSLECDKWAIAAYELADAMLAERSEP
jgi:hypothetical protein